MFVSLILVGRMEKNHLCVMMMVALFVAPGTFMTPVAVTACFFGFSVLNTVMRVPFVMGRTFVSVLSVPSMFSIFLIFSMLPLSTVAVMAMATWALIPIISRPSRPVIARLLVMMPVVVSVMVALLSFTMPMPVTLVVFPMAAAAVTAAKLMVATPAILLVNIVRTDRGQRGPCSALPPLMPR